MNDAITDEARALPTQLERQFSRDAELAKRLANTRRRLERANDRPWKGRHPDGLAHVYCEHPAVVDTAFAETRSEALGADDPLAAVQQVHRSARKAFIDYQAAAEERRQLAADTGETIGEFLDELMAAGWSEEQARNANVHERPATTKQPATNRS